MEHICNITNTTSGAYVLWLKSLENKVGRRIYGPRKLHDYTALTPGLGLIWLAITSLIADLLKSRWGCHCIFTGV